MQEQRLKVSVWRGDAQSGQFQTYEVPRRASQTVLDVVTHIQRHLAPDLGFRFACRVGMCGSCAMTVNGVARWTCRTDERDTRRQARLGAVAGDAGCHACHTQGSCTLRCPKQLAPTASIAGLKRLVARAAMKGEL